MLLNPQETADLIIFTEEILNWKLHFLYSVAKFSSYKGVADRNTWDEYFIWKADTC